MVNFAKAFGAGVPGAADHDLNMTLEGRARKRWSNTTYRNAVKDQGAPRNCVKDPRRKMVTIRLVDGASRATSMTGSAIVAFWEETRNGRVGNGTGRWHRAVSRKRSVAPRTRTIRGMASA